MGFLIEFQKSTNLETFINNIGEVLSSTKSRQLLAINDLSLHEDHISGIEKKAERSMNNGSIFNAKKKSKDFLKTMVKLGGNQSSIQSFSLNPKELYGPHFHGNITEGVIVMNGGVQVGKEFLYPGDMIVFPPKDVHFFYKRFSFSLFLAICSSQTFIYS